MGKTRSTARKTKEAPLCTRIPLNIRMPWGTLSEIKPITRRGKRKSAAKKILEEKTI
jgi:hypothetical protein